MARVEESVGIERPLDQVFAYTTDAKNWPKWQSFILEAEQTSPGTMGIGATFKGVSHVMGRNMKWTATTTEYESNKNWGKNIMCGGVAIEEHVTYNPAGGGTLFTIAYDMKASGFFKLLLPLMASSMRKDTKKSLASLKGIVEA